MIIALGMDTITLWDPHHVVDQMPIDYAASAIFVAAAALDGVSQGLPRHIKALTEGAG